MAAQVDQRPETTALDHRSTVEDRAPPDVATDNELLRQFAFDQRDDAFTQLVERHAAMVLGVCRRVLRDQHEAEDVFQATFLILANKARQIQRRRRASLAAWLHRVAYRAAVRVSRAKHRKGTSLMDDVPTNELEQWLDIARQEEQLLLHEEVNRLPELYREAVVVCCLEGKSRAEAAEQLGSTHEAMQKRVDRGKQMLRMRLARRGVASAAALAAASASSACDAATLPSLVSLTSEICSATVLSADTSIYSTNVGQIAQQGAISMKTLTLTITATTTAIVIGTPLLLLAGLAGPTEESSLSSEVTVTSVASQLPASGASVTVAAEQDEQELDETVRLIMHRQKGDQLKVYLRGRSIFVNGKSISTSQLSTLIAEMGLDQAVITNAAGIVPARVAEIKAFIESEGIGEVKIGTPQLTLAELAEATLEAAALKREANLREIIGRQKDDHLRVYVNGRSMYVNGKTVSRVALATIIQEIVFERATITNAAEVHPDRVAEVKAMIEKEGVEQVEIGTPQLTLEELAVATREQAVRDREEKLRTILSRQKEDQLKVYLNDRSAYVNGRSISAADIQAIIGVSGLEQAVVTAEPYVSQETVTKWVNVIREAGVSEVSLAKPKSE